MLDLDERGGSASVLWGYIKAHGGRLTGEEGGLKNIRLEEDVTGAWTVPESAKGERLCGHVDRDTHAGGGGRAEVAHPNTDDGRNAVLSDGWNLEEFQLEIGLGGLNS